MRKKTQITTDTTGDFFILLCMSAFVVVLSAKALTYAIMVHQMYSNDSLANPNFESTVTQENQPSVPQAQKGLRAI